MIDVVIGFDEEKDVYKVYEPTTDTLFVTASLGDSFLKLSEFLKSHGMIIGDILSARDIRYHMDSACFLAMVESNVNLLKRLNQAPSGFMLSEKRMGGGQQSISQKREYNKGKKQQRFRSSRNFSKSSFNESYKKFGNNGKS